jgi:hypothetical protein
VRTVTIAPRFCGPPTSANGGWTAGLLAQAFGDRSTGRAVEVTLRAPPPLATELTVVDGAHADVLELRDASGVVATARLVEPFGDDFAVPEGVPMGFAEAAAAMEASPVLADPSVHPFPSCFVCGPQRREGDGLRLFPAEAYGGVFVAALRVQPGEGTLPFAWAALDCPSSFPMYLRDDPFPGPLVLGRMTARLERTLRDDEALVISAWRESAQDRKLCTAVVMHDEQGAVVGRARAVWIRLRPTS